MAQLLAFCLLRATLDNFFLRCRFGFGSSLGFRLPRAHSLWRRGGRFLLTRFYLLSRMVTKNGTSMKRKHIIALAIAVAFIGMGAYSLIDNKIDYSDFQKASSSGRRAQVSGSYVKEKGSHYDEKANIFSFYMKDHDGHEMHVQYAGIRPNNFELAPSVVCTGKVEGDVFQASDIQTKCPSRYEGSGKMKMDETE